MNQNSVATREPNPVERQSRDPELVLHPPVDIFEDAEGITLRLDMPGVAKDGLDVRADASNLVIEGSAHIDMPQGMQALYAEIRSTRYRRSFALSRELEAGKVEALMKDGVLTLRVPKRAELRSRKIEVRAG